MAFIWTVLSLNQCLFVLASCILIVPLDFKFSWRHDLVTLINLYNREMHSSRVHCLGRKKLTSDALPQGCIYRPVKVCDRTLFCSAWETKWNLEYVDFLREEAQLFDGLLNLVLLHKIICLKQYLIESFLLCELSLMEGNFGRFALAAAYMACWKTTWITHIIINKYKLTQKSLLEIYWSKTTMRIPRIFMGGMVGFLYWGTRCNKL
jgi:hypothetical protein